jgi:hypothetical protein
MSPCIVIEVKLEQFWNKRSLILVTPLGIIIEVNIEQLENAPSPILVTLLGIVNEVKLEQNLKAVVLILVMLLVGSNVIVVSPERFRNALSPILVKPIMATDVVSFVMEPFTVSIVRTSVVAPVIVTDVDIL